MMGFVCVAKMIMRSSQYKKEFIRKCIKKLPISGFHNAKPAAFLYQFDFFIKNAYKVKSGFLP